MMGATVLLVMLIILILIVIGILIYMAVVSFVDYEYLACTLYVATVIFIIGVSVGWTLIILGM